MSSGATTRLLVVVRDARALNKREVSVVDKEKVTSVDALGNKCVCASVKEVNTILERRASALAKSFRQLSAYSPTKEAAKRLAEQGKIDPSKPSKELVNEILKEGMKYGLHIPFFYKKEEKIYVYQEKLFDSFVLSSIFANFLRGIDQYPAGICMHENGYTQFSLFCHYSSIFQLVNAMLSLHGICFVSHPISGINIETVKKEKLGRGMKEIEKFTFTYLGQKCLQGNYKSGKWIFVPCGFSHEERWKRFAEVLKRYIGNGWVDQIPIKVKRYFGYLKVMEEYREHRWKPKNSYSTDFKDMNEFKKILNQSPLIIPKIRHESIYRNIRYDIAERVYINQGIFPEKLLEARIEILREFNESMVDWVYRYILGTLYRVKEVLDDDSLYFKALNIVSYSPIIKISDPDLKRMQESPELDKINKNIKEIIPLLLPPDKVVLEDL